MNHSAYSIYNASAGSGKTFTLAKSYLKILISSQKTDQFKSILAITFTNRAVGEMKTRIIGQLKCFASEDNLANPDAMGATICEELNMTTQELQSKAGKILKHIIHQYGAFEISTIDGFTQRIIRTFAHDLQLPLDFEVELDQDRLLNEAVDNLISKAGTDARLTKTLIDFAIEKADNDKSWDISLDFYKIAKLLTYESDYAAVQTLKGKSLDDFEALKLVLLKKIKSSEIQLKKTAEDALQLIESNGIAHSDFSGSYVPKYFQGALGNPLKLTFGQNWQSALTDGDRLYPKRVESKSVAKIIEDIQSELSKAFLEIKAEFFQLTQNKAFYKNITPLSVLTSIQHELDALKTVQNKMLISEFNTIIANEIKDQPTPFIYERLGEKYKHYFIDEFQDTSVLQWQNLTALIDNGLSAAGGTAMLVGDAKQAIYRWRGGKAEQFIDLYNKKTNPFLVVPNVLPLDTNYRSAQNIIKWNNAFFEFVGSRYFNNEDYANLYRQAKQNFNNDQEGYVNITFLDPEKDDDLSELYVQKVFDTVTDCLKNGFQLRDICVLVRQKKEGVAIANYLSENNIPITSSETLLLQNSAKVRFLNAFLKLLIQPENAVLKIEVLTFIAKQRGIEDLHLFYTTHLKDSLYKTLDSLQGVDIFISIKQLLQLPLYELVEQLIRTFSLHNQSDAYLQFYLDVVLEFTQKQKSDISSFVAYFEKKKGSLSIISPENLDAVEIMTIHKSKGLEFPVVIFPFADLNIYKEIEPKTWFPIDKTTHHGFEKLLINYNKDVENFGEEGSAIFTERRNMLELDAINLLYVVMTRAAEQLYVISKIVSQPKGDNSATCFAGILKDFLENQGKWSDAQHSYSFGTPIKTTCKKEDTSTPIPLKLISTAKETHQLNIVTKAGLLWDTEQEKAMERGNLVHLILSKINTIQDIPFAFEALLTSGDIPLAQAETLKTLINQVVDHPELERYFAEDPSNSQIIYNEKDIVTDFGKTIRPDRLNIYDDKTAVVIDYKTGEPSPLHALQLNNYESVLNTMGYTITSKLLVYINEVVEVMAV